MKIWIPCLLGLLSACATHHAARVSCESNLIAINAPVASAQESRADAAARKMLDGAP